MELEKQVLTSTIHHKMKIQLIMSSNLIIGAYNSGSGNILDGQ